MEDPTNIPMPVPADNVKINDVVDDTDAVTEQTSVAAEKTKPQNVIMSEPVYSELDDSKYMGEELSLPSDYRENVTKSIENLPNIKFDDNEKTRAWANTVSEGNELTSFNSVFKKTLEN